MEGKQGVNLVEPWRMGDAGDGDQTPPTHTSAMMPTPTHPQRSAAEEDERLQRVRQIISREFDVEILHKWREVRIIEDELDKAAQLRTLLEKLLLNEQVYAGAAPAFVTSQPVSRMSTPGGSSATPSGLSSPRRLRHSSSSAVVRPAAENEPGPLYEMCPDGSVVRLRCPVCGADKFRSTLGLVNHCRINCGLLVSNPDDRIQQCGIPVSMDEIPPGYFQSTKASGHLRRDRELAQIRAGVQAPIIDVSRRPMIREFSESDTSIVLSKNDQRSVSSAGANVLGSLTGNQADVRHLSSRYHVRKRICIGNYARCLDSGLEEEEAAEKQIPTHEWRLFLRPHDPHDDLSAYIKAVRFQLHPSYKPNDIIEIDRKPFELVMTGWGEFPARIQVIFQDPKNHPVEFSHFIRLRPCHSRQAQLMSEQAYDLELDRKSTGSGSKRDSTAAASSEKTFSVDDALAVASRFFPLFGPIPKQSPSLSSSYNRAVSYAEYMKLSSFDRQALERERAIALQRHLLPQNEGLTVEYVIEWCRKNGLSPVIVSAPASGSTDHKGKHRRRSEDGDEDDGDEDEDGVGITEEELCGLQYCRYCGIAHFPQEKMDILLKNCSMRPRRLHLSSRSTASQLMTEFTLAPDPLPDYPKRPRLIEPPSQEISLAEIATWPEESQWVNQAILPLELSSYSPRQDTCAAIGEAAKKFLADLMQAAITKIPDTIERAVGRPALITPVHLYQAITGMTPVSAVAPKDSSANAKEAAGGPDQQQAAPAPNRFDFLCNAYMAGT